MSYKIKRKFIVTALIVKLFLVLGLVIFFSAHPPSKSMAQYHYAPDMVVGDIIEDTFFMEVSIRQALDQGMFGDISFADAPAMKAFYADYGRQPLWLDKEMYHPRVIEVLDVLEKSWVHGLNPAQYHVDEIKRLLFNPLQNRQAQLELLVSDAVIRYGTDLTGMRVNPKSIRQKSKYWRQPMRGYDILQNVALNEAPQEAMEALAPQGILYKALQKELVKITREEGAYDHLLPIVLGTAYFKPGDRHANVAKLRTRLGVAYDPVYGSASKYDDPLAASVIEFQRKHGLETDGIIGPNTLKLLNRTREDSLNQIMANLERLRWLDQDRPDRYILVNIPSATLWAVENNKVALEMPVIVGKSWRQTKSFKTDVTGVRFNPTWTVPLRLKWEDILPKLRKDTSYLTDKGMDLFQGYGKSRKTLDPDEINWHTMTWKKLSKIRMVQRPGENNALGRFRILMENPYNIYMHDTNSPEYFDKTQRMLSSGCIRMAKPALMAHFILGKNKDWSDQKMQEILATGKMTEVKSETSMPVYILYQTVWLNEHGKLVFGPDIYRRDKKLIAELQGIDAIDMAALPGPVRSVAVNKERTTIASVE